MQAFTTRTMKGLEEKLHKSEMTKQLSASIRNKMKSTLTNKRQSVKRASDSTSNNDLKGLTALLKEKATSRERSNDEQTESKEDSKETFANADIDLEQDNITEPKRIKSSKL